MTTGAKRQNVTLSLPRSLLRRAKIVAARREKSLTELMREALEEKIGDDTGYRAARKRQTAILGRGIDLGTGGHIAVSREDLHAR